MRFSLSVEQDDMRRSIRKFLEVEAPVTELVQRIEDPLSRRQTWDRLVRELGMLEVAGEPSEATIELVVLARELGRALAGSDFLNTTLTIRALQAARQHDVAELRDSLVDGDASVYVSGIGAGVSGPRQATATYTDRWTITGRLSGLAPSSPADHGVVVANTADGPKLFVVHDFDLAAPSQQLDLLRPFAVFELADHPATLVDLGDQDHADVIEQLGILSQLLVAAESIGSAEICLDLAIEHAKTREQFGQPIGAFQAIKHRCADTALAIEAARAAMFLAAWERSQGDPSGDVHCRMARSSCSEAFQLATESVIQVLGGTGFTWEHPAHLYHRRSLASRQLFGTVAENRSLVAAALVGNR